MVFCWVIFLTSLVALTVMVMARGSTFDGYGSDSIMQVNAAARFKEWRWPSDMHRFAGQKAWMKDVGVLVLVLMQFIFKDNKSFYPVVMVSALSHCTSGILIFVVAENYWGIESAIAIFFLYMFCFWPYQIVLHGGLQVVAQMFFLFSVFSLQRAGLAGSNLDVVCFFFSGGLFGLMTFSSASSRKFVPLYLAALLYHASGSTPPSLVFTKPGFSVESGAIACIVMAALITSTMLFTRIFYRPLVRLIYYKRLPVAALNNVFRNTSRNTLEYYFRETQKRIIGLYGPAAFSVIFLTLPLIYFSKSISYLLLLYSFLGFIAVVFLLTYPNISSAIKGYLMYMNAENWGSHYPLYSEYFKKRYGRIYQSGKEGVRWYFRFYWRMIPFHMILIFLTVLFLLMTDFCTTYSLGTTTLAFVILLSISPIIWSDISKGPKASLPLYPSLVPLLIPIGYSISQISHFGEPVSGISSSWFFWFCWIMVFSSSAWNAYIFLTDTWPCRMALSKVVDFLRSRGIVTIFTYRTRYNEPFMDLLEKAYPGEFRVEYIDSLAQVSNGYIFVPPTSSKGVYYQSSSVGPAGDYEADETLNFLIGSRQIENCAITTFKTLSTSKYWQHLGNISSFRDLILGEVTEIDRYRGFAWILDASKIKTIR